MTRSFLIGAIAAASLLAGCAIPPRPQHPDLSASAPLAGVPASKDAAWPDRAWWTRYHDAQLDDLQTRALAGSPTLAVARARLEQAVRHVDVARADGGVAITGNAQVQRQRLSEHGLIPSEFLGFNWYSLGDLGVSFQYDFDFWGSRGADIAAAISRARAAEAERDAAASVLTAAVAQTYFMWQADQARLAIAGEIVKGYEQGRAIVAARAHQGLNANDVVHRADAELAGAREQVAMLEGDARIQLAALAGLLGLAPADLPKLEARPLPAANTSLPADAGLDLIARRADVAASRWRVEAALKDVDVARAAFYPNLSLAGMIGLSSIDLGKLLNPGSTVVALGPALHLPIFESGRLHSRFGVSQAALAAAVADYHAAVVNAAHEVSTQALTLQQIQQRRQQSAEQLAAKAQILDGARARMRQGVINAIPVLDAAETLDRQRDAIVQLDVAALTTEIALTRALGGGYHGPTQSPSTSLSGAPSP
jgi:multidrug efflux system outer membrane protein